MESRPLGIQDKGGTWRNLFGSHRTSTTSEIKRTYNDEKGPSANPLRKTYDSSQQKLVPQDESFFQSFRKKFSLPFGEKTHVRPEKDEPKSNLKHTKNITISDGAAKIFGINKCIPETFLSWKYFYERKELISKFWKEISSDEVIWVGISKKIGIQKLSLGINRKMVLQWNRSPRSSVCVEITHWCQ
jgi:hypothetical protein